MKRSSSAWYRQQIAKVLYQRGLTFASQTDYKRAIAAFTQSLSSGHPQPAKVQLERGISLSKSNQIEAAIVDFETAIQTNSAASFTLAQAHHHRGLLRQKAGNEAGALADWSAAIAHCNTYPEPHYQRGLVSLSQGLHDRALADFNDAIAADPTLTLAYLQRGNLRHQLGDIPGAVADWEIAICNDFTLESAKQKLSDIKQDAHDAKLSNILKAPLAKLGLTVAVSHHDAQLDIHIHRQLGTGVNYFTLPKLIQQHLAPLQLSEITRFRLIGHLAEVNRPEWNQSYDLYKGQPCPPSNWQPAISALVMFPPLGIPAFIQAARVKQLYKSGRYIESLRASKAVKGFCMAGSITLGCFVLFPLSYAAFDSMKENPTFNIAEQPEAVTRSAYQRLKEE